MEGRMMNKKSLLKTTLAILLSFALLGCVSKSSSSADFNGKEIVIHLESADTNTGFTGDFEVDPNVRVVVDTQLEKGKVTMRLERGDATDQANPPVDYELSGKGVSEYAFDGHTYSAHFNVIEKATGEIRVYTVPAEVNDDGQNPVMNFIGNYQHDRCSILIEADGKDGAKAHVHWGSSASESTEWEMSGAFDTNTLTFTYDNGVKKDVVYKGDGAIESETVDYENSTGTMVFKDDGTLIWTDDKDENIKELVFEYLN